MNKQPVRSQVFQFHVTRQLGYKPILYCWCGASIDTNKNSWQALRAFKLAHEGVCEQAVSKLASEEAREESEKA